jgi:phage-related protein
MEEIKKLDFSKDYSSQVNKLENLDKNFAEQMKSVSEIISSIKDLKEQFKKLEILNNVFDKKIAAYDDRVKKLSDKILVYKSQMRELANSEAKALREEIAEFCKSELPNDWTGLAADYRKANQLIRYCK